ncbi:tRNA threonylcarbamoyladenosine biosynthesis protein TsaB [Rubinisphaera italica]|uniref:tRNA threonylcarbamoyladenosine biosynthesis protein TsaB n=2 Tax=Rubinisphaera italica TaxID=2527969 RepID=A0A5C5XJ33_9PLAN|nr:tRNA threonylcarbamoyladenosine biosynthesis protein TsaB [Rubinisphaera italica]
MLILGLECTGKKSSVALVRDEKLIAISPLQSDFGQPTQKLFSTVQSLCQDNEVSWSEIELLAITHGPGSFTGLRVGITFAKTFAYVTGCPLKAVSTFAATAQGLTISCERVEVIEDLRKGQVAWQRFEVQDDVWIPSGPLIAEELDVWKNHDHSGVIYAGLGIPRLTRQLPNQTWPADWKLAPEDDWSPDAATVARCGRLRFLEEGSDDPFQLQPLYIRRSAAEEKAQAK